MLGDLKALAEVLRGKLRLYFAANMLYLLAWRFIPIFVVANCIIEEYSGSLFHVALFETSISLATVASMFIVDKIPERYGFNATMLSTIGVAAATLVFYAEPPSRYSSSASLREYSIRRGSSSIETGSSKLYREKRRLSSPRAYRR